MPHITTHDELLAIAQQRCEAGRFDDGLECLGKIIDRQTTPSLAALLLRAKTYASQGLNGEALDDARAAIKHHPMDVRGYIQAGSILKKMGKSQAALKLYEYGLQKKPADLARLHRAHASLKRELVASDPFDLFPVELIESVLAHLSFRQMVRCIRVSKAWHHTITTLPNLWYNIDLSGAPAYLGSSTAQGKRYNSVSNEFISACIRRSQNKIRTVRLQNLRSRDKVVYALATSCKQLQSLCTSQSGIYSETFVNSIAPTASLKRLEIGPAGTISLNTIMSLLKASPQLEHFASIVDPRQGFTVQNDATTFSPGLRSFSLRVIESPRLDQQAPSIMGFEHFVAKFKNIESIVLEGVGIVFPLASGTFERCLDLAYLLSLRRFEVKGHTRRSADHERHGHLILADALRIVALHHGCVHLPTGNSIVELDLAGIEQLKLKIGLDARFPELKKLTIHCYGPELYMWECIPNEQLSELHVTRETLISDRDMYRLADNRSSLRALTLANSQITGLGVLALLKLPNFKRLTIRGTFIEPDVIQRCRDHGVLVNYSGDPDPGRNWRRG